MQKNYVYKSVALHIAVVLLCVFDIPFLGSKRNFDEQPPIMVDLENVKISDTTNIPAKAVRGPEKNRRHAKKSLSKRVLPLKKPSRLLHRKLKKSPNRSLFPK